MPRKYGAAAPRVFSFQFSPLRGEFSVCSFAAAPLEFAVYSFRRCAASFQFSVWSFEF
jgi:hypothetical protein